MDPVGGSEKKIEPNKNNIDVDLDDFDTQPVDDEISPFGGKFSYLFIIIIFCIQFNSLFSLFGLLVYPFFFDFFVLKWV